MQRLQATISQGLWYVSDYSGYDSPREALTILHEALGRHGYPLALAPRYVRACDIGGVQQQILTGVSAASDDGTCCVFKDISERMTQNAKTIMQKMTGGVSSGTAIAKEANETFTSWLRQAESAFNIKATSWCCQHQRACPVYPMAVLRSFRQSVSSSGGRPQMTESRSASRLFKETSQ